MEEPTVHKMDAMCIHDVTYEHCRECGRSLMIFPDADVYVLADGDDAADHLAAEF